MQIQKLESDLGITIFDRSKKPILLTPAGAAVLEQIKIVLAEANKIQAIVERSVSNTLSGELRLAIIPTLAPYTLPLLLPILETTHKDIRLQILELQTSRIVEALNHDEIDVGLLATPLKISSICEHPLYYEPFYLFCNDTHPLASSKKIRYSDLSNTDLWLLEEGHCMRHQMMDICSSRKSQSTKRKYKFESGNLETIKNLVSSFGGATLLPELAANALPKKTKLISFERPIPAREIGLVYRREHYKIELIEALADTIITSLPENIRRLRRKDLDVIPIE